MTNFWDYSVWASLNLIAVLLISLLVGNILKKRVRFLAESLIPTSVISGVILLIVKEIYKSCTGMVMFNTPFFGGNGTDVLEIITYHTLALGFIAATFTSTDGKTSKERTIEIANTGITTVATYLLQAVFGIAISMIAAKFVAGFLPAAGTLLPLGYGQGTGQALNFGSLYETDYGFAGGKAFGLTIAALGFISAGIGGVIHMNIGHKRGKIKVKKAEREIIDGLQIQTRHEIPMQENMDKITVQFAFILGAYLLAYIFMLIIGGIAPGLKSVIYGFNFLLGVISASLIKFVIRRLRLKRIIRKQYINNFFMTRLSNFFYDLMIVAGVAAIRLSALENYWGIIIIMGIIGAVITYVYNLYVAKHLFPQYKQEQFLAMYGMLTGTASTGMMLLREVDPHFSTPAAENLVYQNFVAIVLGFPMMLFASYAPKNPVLVLVICFAYFAVLNIVLFRAKIFKKKQ